jgi:hypothetical protein
MARGPGIRGAVHGSGARGLLALPRRGPARTARHAALARSAATAFGRRAARGPRRGAPAAYPLTAPTAWRGLARGHGAQLALARGQHSRRVHSARLARLRCLRS